jgi:serine/threonine-protein kinase
LEDLSEDQRLTIRDQRFARRHYNLRDHLQLTVGTRLGPYEIVNPLGAGGMGEVYRARDTQLNRSVAIKVLPEVFAVDHERLARFTREAQTLAAVNHPNIAQIYGLEGTAGTRAIAMELVDGEDLSVIIERGAIPLTEAFAIARQIAEALEAAHDVGIIHRDLKPGNVKVRDDGTVKVLDFGLAKATEPGGPPEAATITSPAMTQMGVILGTAAYMSPEQARGKPVDRRSDIWAFGVVLFEMLTGRRPFEGNTVSDVIASVIKERLPLEDLPRDVPPPVATLIARCLEKDSKLRLRDIGEARILLSGAPVVASAPVTAKARWLLPTTAALTGALLTAAVLWLWRPANPASREVVRFDVLPPGSSEVNLTIRPSVSISPDGSAIALAASTNGVSRLYVRRRDGVDARELPGVDDVSHPVLSPDGRSLAAISGRKLVKVALDGAVVALADVNDPRGLAWVDAASIVYAPEAAQGLMKISADGGQPKPVTTPDVQKGERSHRWPSTLPGGQIVLFTVGAISTPDDYDSSNIDAVTLATGKRQTVLQGASMATYTASGHLLFARGGTLHAAAFDLKNLRVTGNPMPIVQGVMGDRTTGAAHFSVAENGTLVYVPGTSIGDQHLIAWVNTSGAPASTAPQTTVTTLLDLPKGPYNDLAISPDGSRVAFVQGNSGIDADVWIYDLNRKTMTRLTFDKGSAAPSWSEDGRTIYYSSIDTIKSKTTFMRKLADGSRDAEPLGAIDWRGYLRKTLAAGSTAILEASESRGSGSERNIYRIQLTPGKTDSVRLEPVVATRADEYASDVSANGRWLAYSSDESGRMEVYVRDLSNAAGRWQISTSGGEEPHWSPDGGRLYYRSGNGLFAVAIDSRNGFSAATPQLLFRGAYNVRSDTGLTFDVDPKTGRLLMVRPAIDDKARAPVRVVLNWFEELKTKFGR